MAMAMGADEGAEIAAARRLGFADLSPMVRSGYKGTGTLGWVRDQDQAVPEANNAALAWSDGTVIARLADTEVLLLGGFDGADAGHRGLAAAWAEARPEMCFPVPRADMNAEVLISGAQAPAMLAKLCAVDLRPRAFPDHGVAQTVLAGLDAVVLRADLGRTPAYRIVFDIASARYLWRCIDDAAMEFAGAPVGLAALRHLAAEIEG